MHDTQEPESKKKLFPLFSRAPARKLVHAYTHDRAAISDGHKAVDDATVSRPSATGPERASLSQNIMQDSNEEEPSQSIDFARGLQNKAITIWDSSDSTMNHIVGAVPDNRSRKSNEKAAVSSKSRFAASTYFQPVLLRDSGHNLQTRPEQSNGTRPPPSDSKVIVISDSPIRESAPFAPAGHTAKLTNRPRRSSGFHASMPPASWPCASNVHVRSEPSQAIVASTSRSTIEDQLQALSGHLLDHRIRLTRYTGRGSEINTFHIHDYARAVSTGLRKHASPPVHSRRDILQGLYPQTVHNSCTATNDIHSQLLTQIHSPKRTDDVLGDRSRSSAMFLRDWLCDQALPKAPYDVSLTADLRELKRKVQRGPSDAQRKRAKKEKLHARRMTCKSAQGIGSGLEDFIVSDHESEEEDRLSGRGADSDAFPSPTKSHTSTATLTGHAIADTRILFNAILLTGPVGSGKTSSVYAAANELDWQVFEVYPGIGSRSQRELDRLIGMVGSNHIVHRQTMSLFNSTSNGVSGSNVLEIVDTGPVVKQSLLLIEEVDVLYASDAGFWDALCAFIAESRRPVVMTCNEIEAVPLSRLALQAILHFERPTEQSLCASFRGEVNNVPALANESKTHEQVDVRAILMQLHLKPIHGRDNRSSTNAPGNHAKPFHLREICAASDICSFVDSHVTRRAFMALDDAETLDIAVGDYLAGHSETPWIQIHSVSRSPLGRPLPCFARESEFVEYLVGVDSTSALERLSNDTLQQLYRSIVTTMTGQNGTHLANVTLTVPYLQFMVEIDDALQSAYMEALAAEEEESVSDARVRRSRRLAKGSNADYPRYKGIDGEAVQMIRDSTLRWECM